MTTPRHRGPPERPRLATWIWLTVGSAAITVGTIAVAVRLGPSPGVPDAVEPPPEARSVWTPRDLPSLNVPTPSPAVSSRPGIATKSSLTASQPRRVSTVTPRAAQDFQGAQGQVTEAPLAHSDTAAPPAPDRTPIAPTREPAPIEETQVVEVEQPVETAVPTPTDELAPTDIPDLIEEIVETDEPEVTP